MTTITRKKNELAFGFLILFFFENFKFVNLRPDPPHSNGHVPDCEPTFDPSRIYGIHHRRDLAPSEDYGTLPPANINDRNRIVGLAECREGSAGGIRVFDLYSSNNPATRRTVNGFLCGEGNDSVLLQKVEDGKYNKIRYDHYLRDNQVAALGQGNQQG